MAEVAERLMHTGQHLAMNSEEYLAILVDAELSARKSKRFNLMLKKANLRPEKASLENLRYQEGRGFKNQT